MLEPLPQERDGSGMYRYRTNERLVKKLHGGRKCLLEAAMFATAMHLGELGLSFPAKRLEIGLRVHEINVKLQEAGVFQLCAQQLACPRHSLDLILELESCAGRWLAEGGSRRRAGAGAAGWGGAAPPYRHMGPHAAAARHCHRADRGHHL